MCFETIESLDARWEEPTNCFLIFNAMHTLGFSFHIHPRPTVCSLCHSVYSCQPRAQLICLLFKLVFVEPCSRGAGTPILLLLWTWQLTKDHIQPLQVPRAWRMLTTSMYLVTVQKYSRIVHNIGGRKSQSLILWQHLLAKPFDLPISLTWWQFGNWWEAGLQKHVKMITKFSDIHQSSVASLPRLAFRAIPSARFRGITH